MIHILKNLLDRIYIAKFQIGYRIIGIEYVSRTISQCPGSLLPQVLTLFGAKVGKGNNCKDGLQIDNAFGGEDTTEDFSHLIIGERCYIGKGVFFDLPDVIKLEDEVLLGAGVKIFTHWDCGNRVMSRWYPRRRAPVTIGYGSWIGANATILCGVTLGQCCVVAAGSVVLNSAPSYAVLGGVPARIIKYLPSKEERTQGTE
jgi:acetyltransferase-like isoleucine patch superfamily enzyme